MVQFVFSGGLFSVAGTMVVNQVSWLFPARWGMAALASTSSLNRIDRDPTQAFDTTWNHNGSTWALDMALLLALGVMYLLFSWRRLARRTPGRRASGRRR
jgi:hypothetical protein